MTMELEASGMGKQKALALAVTIMVQRLACKSASKFDRVNSEWLLVPDDWLKVKYIAKERPPGGVRLSVGLPVAAFPPALAHWVTMKRWPGWSTFWIRQQDELPAVQQLLNLAFYQADSEYRDRHGKPNRLAEWWSAYFVEGESPVTGKNFCRQYGHDGEGIIPTKRGGNRVG